MPQDDLVKALLQAQKMDKAAQEEVDIDQGVARDEFLKAISGVESSFGKNFNHRPITSGIHKGDEAIGSYGLMPNTIKEVSNRERMANNLPENMEQASKMDSAAMKKHLESNPQLEKQFADSLAQKVLTDQPSEEQAAYSWLYGHNLAPEKIEKRNYKNDDYVQKFRKIKKLLGK